MYVIRVRGEEWANVYWLGDIEEQIKKQVWEIWGTFVEAQIPDAEWPKTELHSTMIFDKIQQSEIQEKWNKEAGQEQEINSDSILIGPEGTALTIRKNEWVRKWFSVPETEPHVTLKVNPDYRPKDLGLMTFRAQELEFIKANNENIWMSTDGQMMKISVNARMTGRPKEVKIELKDKEVEQEWRAKLEKDLDSLPEELWSMNDTDVGKVKTATPVEVKLKPGCQGPYKPQYPIKAEAVKGIRETIRGLVDAGVLKETRSKCNTPLLPVKKADGEKWRLVHDLRAVNEVVENMPVEVPNPYTLLTNIPSESRWLTVIDLCSAFFSVPLAQASQYLFAFKYKGKYNRMPQGFKHSPHVFNQVLRADLAGIQLEGTLIQYVDDLLLCTETKEQCREESLKLLGKLAKGGHKVSRNKLQFCQRKVEYLGREITVGQKRIAHQQIEAVLKIPKPQTVRQMMTFLGMTGFSSEWIENYAEKTQALRKIMKEAGCEELKVILIWDREASEAFDNVKQEMVQAPALMLPSYDKPFDLFVSNRETGFATAVLMQDSCKGRKKQAIAYYSTKLDDVALGYPPCYQDLAAAWWAYEKAATITMGYLINIHVHHKVAELIEQGKFVLTPARIHHYRMLTTFPDITIIKCNRVNPADYMPLPHEGKEHECLREAKTFMKLREDLRAEGLVTEEKRTLYVDGSCYRDHLGNHAGYAIVEQRPGGLEVIEAEKCEQPCSAQLAELKALTRACELAKGEAVEVYTDSAYAHGVCHLFGSIWKQRGFMKSSGGPIQHESQIKALIQAMMGPKELAIIFGIGLIMYSDNGEHGLQRRGYNGSSNNHNWTNLLLFTACFEIFYYQTNDATNGSANGE
ncbi:uncharacterized protein LOC144482328 isoform X1 [Mustelus asterias]